MYRRLTGLAAKVREKRFEAVCEAAAALFRRGFLVFSPIAHTHPIAKHGIALGWTFWQSYDREHIGNCSQVWVLTLDGWKESIGLSHEIEMFKEAGKPIHWLPEVCNRDHCREVVDLLKAGFEVQN